MAGGAANFVRRAGVPAPIQGVVRATEIRIAPEVGGHLAVVRVSKGVHVKAGDVIAELSTLELTASVQQARAAYQSALADRNNIYAGVRDEEIAILASEIEKAQSRRAYAEQQLSRVDQLRRQNFASRLALDQAEIQAATARGDVAEATSNYASAKAGPTREERAIADAQVSVAAAGLAVLESRLQKTILTAPAEGIVSVVAAEVGEAIRVGQTIVTIEATTQPWVSFNVRKDRLTGIAVGTAVDVLMSGTSAQMPGRVTEVTPIGQFATWQAERAVGDHDRNTLHLRVEPQQAPSRFEPGMTVWLVGLR
jgi:HlyD family secretion protein